MRIPEELTIHAAVKRAMDSRRDHIDTLVTEAMEEWMRANGFTEQQINGETDE